MNKNNNNMEENNRFVYTPLSGELAPQFINRVLKIAKYEALNQDEENIIVKTKIDKWLGYSIIELEIDSNDDLNEALNKYYIIVKERRLQLFGGR